MTDMENKMILKAFVEVGKDGLFAVCTDDNPFGMIAGYGDSVKEAMEDFDECRKEMVEIWKQEGKEAPELEFTFRYDTVSFLQYYSGIISLAGLQKLTGIDRHQLSHYVTGKSKPSPKTVAKIQKGVTDLAKELNSICLF